MRAQIAVLCKLLLRDVAFSILLLLILLLPIILLFICFALPAANARTEQAPAVTYMLLLITSHGTSIGRDPLRAANATQYKYDWYLPFSFVSCSA